MRDDLAERLLAEVMGWSPEDVARERPDLQAIASQKYDEYQQFSPGMRFVESLASWLRQMKTKEERAAAYDFVKKRLVFFSAAEVNHLVSIAFPDHIRPLLLQKAAKEAGLDPYEVSTVAQTREFRLAKRQCLFLGLSDGARIDIFRRHNNSELGHEQILQTSEISKTRSEELLKRLSVDVKELFGDETPPPEVTRYRTIILLDDFSASGISYLRNDGTKPAEEKPEGFFQAVMRLFERRVEANPIEGKVGKFLKEMADSNSPLSRLVDDKTEVWILLYIATDRAKKYLEETTVKLDGVPKCTVIVVNQLSQSICLQPGEETPLDGVLSNYYDSTIEDEHTKKGGTDLRHGFAGCGLPLILHHNTPNNSLALLWAETDKVRALFPRVVRHRKH